MLVRGAVVLRDFGVADDVVASPVMADFFSFFYQLMVVFGLLMILLGHIAKELGAQRFVSRAFFVLSLLAALRDLSTSDSRFGNHLYKGDKTLIFVFIDLAFAVAFGALAFSRVQPGPPPRA